MLLLYKFWIVRSFVKDIWRYLTYDSKGAWHTAYTMLFAMFLLNKKSDVSWLKNHTVEKNSIDYSQIIKFSVSSVECDIYRLLPFYLLRTGELQWLEPLEPLKDVRDGGSSS